MTEKEKMCAGAAFDPSDAEIAAERARLRDLCFGLSETRISDMETIRDYYRRILPDSPDVLWIAPPFRCEMGNIRAGKAFIGNYDMRVIDYARVTIGDRVFIGPRCLIDTRVAPRTKAEAASRLITARPVTIGDSVWFGSGVTVCAGVTIGCGCVIGAGSVVTCDIPERSFAAGNPARVVRSLDYDELVGR